MDNATVARYLKNLLTVGRVVQVNASLDQYRVEFDGPDGPVLSGWLLRMTSRAGGDAETWHYDTGEQVLVAALAQNLEVGVILGAVNQASHPPASTAAGVYRKTFSDGTVIEYDRNTSELTVAAAGNITINVQGDAAITVAGEASMDATAIRLNGGAGVVTGESRCHFDGLPHSDCSLSVFAGKV